MHVGNGCAGVEGIRLLIQKEGVEGRRGFAGGELQNVS